LHLATRTASPRPRQRHLDVEQHLHFDETRDRYAHSTIAGFVGPPLPLGILRCRQWRHAPANAASIFCGRRH
jgi:hypothetical protein